MIREGDKVTLIKLPKRDHNRIRVGMKGVVIATRPAIDERLLVKFEGRRGLISVDPNEVKGGG